MLDDLVKKIILKEISKEKFFKKLESIDALADIDVRDLENLRVLGLPIYEDKGELIVKTALTPIKEQKFCIVDIEANGCKKDEHQIIEIGAVTVQNGVETDKFESFVCSDFLPDSITQLTGINMANLENAPSLGFVMEKFRLFLGESVFVAHNVNFDYNFISATLQKLGFGPLLNRKLCSIEFAKKSIQTPKYGLSSLMEYFDVSFGEHHRALCDARMSAYIFNECLKVLPKDIYTTEDLISFVMPEKRRKNRSKNSYM